MVSFQPVTKEARTEVRNAVHNNKTNKGRNIFMAFQFLLASPEYPQRAAGLGSFPACMTERLIALHLLCQKQTGIMVGRARKRKFYGIS